MRAEKSFELRYDPVSKGLQLHVPHTDSVAKVRFTKALAQAVAYGLEKDKPAPQGKREAILKTLSEHLEEKIAAQTLKNAHVLTLATRNLPEAYEDGEAMNGLLLSAANFLRAGGHVGSQYGLVVKP